jgi:hypothetical protein
MQKMTDFLKIHKHVLIDYTDEFINIECLDRAYNIYLLIDDKTKKEKYNNIVFLLDILKLVKYNRNFYILLVNKSIIPPKTDLYFLKNSANFCYFKINEFEINKKMISDFIKQKLESYDCNVCFENKITWNECEFCVKCNFRTCIKCIIKSGKQYKNCFSCKNDNRDKLDFIHNTLLKKSNEKFNIKYVI